MTKQVITYPHLSKFHKTTIENHGTLDKKVIDKLIRCFDSIENISVVHVNELNDILVRFYENIGMLENMNLREAGFTIRAIDFQSAAIHFFYLERERRGQ